MVVAEHDGETNDGAIGADGAITAAADEEQIVDEARERNFRDSFEWNVAGRIHALNRMRMEPRGNNRAPTEEQVRTWRAEARSTLDSNVPVQLSPIAFSLLLCNSPKLTVWQKMCTTFFISCH